MNAYASMNQEERANVHKTLLAQFEEFKNQGLKLDMSRGKPGADQLDLSLPVLDCVNGAGNCRAEDGTDCRNYGLLDGIPEAKRLFADLMEVSPDEVIIGGNSSLNLIYDAIARAMSHGVYDGDKPWSQCGTIKFLCPAPGYDRHFAITEYFGFEMITVPMLSDGPDMDMVEKLVVEDEAIKGMWCVPKYSNPDGITYSDTVVRRIAALRPKAKDFRVFWDNAYIVHHLDFENPDRLLNLLEEAKKVGNEDIVYMFASTSKITFPGAGVSCLAASKANIDFTKKQLFFQTISYDKLNQLRHVRYFKNADGILEHMKRHAEILRPKFQVVFDALDREIAPLGIGSWHTPKGGYFVSFNACDGCAKRIVALCKEAGVTLTGAGATYPYGKDPKDANIRIAPTFPPVEELKTAMELFCLCVKLATIEQLV